MQACRSTEVIASWLRVHAGIYSRIYLLFLLDSIGILTELGMVTHENEQSVNDALAYLLVLNSDAQAINIDLNFRYEFVR